MFVNEIQIRNAVSYEKPKLINSSKKNQEL